MVTSRKNYLQSPVEYNNLEKVSSSDWLGAISGDIWDMESNVGKMVCGNWRFMLQFSSIQSLGSAECLHKSEPASLNLADMFCEICRSSVCFRTDSHHLKMEKVEYRSSS